MFKKYVFLVLISVFFFAAIADARLVHIKADKSGEFQSGSFKERSDIFEAEFMIDRAKGTVTVEDVLRSTREGRDERGKVYEITNIVEGKGLSEFMISKKKMGQEMVMALCDDVPGTTEVMIIGKDFYEFCRAINGKFYLESGAVIERSSSEGK